MWSRRRDRVSEGGREVRMSRVGSAGIDIGEGKEGIIQLCLGHEHVTDDTLASRSFLTR